MRLGLALFLGIAAACTNNSNGEGVPVLPEFLAQNFPGGPVTNPFFPLAVGSVRTYEKMTDEGLEQVVVEVTADTKVILGVTCVVVRDTVTLDGEVIEDTFDWFAQDMDGNVWYLGEDSKEYEDGMVVSTEGSWEAGVDGALAGIIMWGAPVVGTTYRQEFYEGEAEDMGTVIALDAMVTVPWGAFAGCLETEDFTPLEPGHVEAKYYAPGIGLVLEVDEEAGRTELVEVE
jgi:hypothetical protein